MVLKSVRPKKSLTERVILNRKLKIQNNKIQSNQFLSQIASQPQMYKPQSTAPDAEDVILLGNEAYGEAPAKRKSSHCSHEQHNEKQQERKQISKSRLSSRVSVYDVEAVRNSDVIMDNFERIMENNLIWSQETQKNDPEFFERLKNIQTPEYLWIGCSDSRVPANQIVGLKPGELFVHRNIANQAPLSDINALAVIQYAVEYLKVKDIIVCGHYGCGGVRAAFKREDHGPLESWLSYVRNLRARYRKEFGKHDQKENEDLLVELNVKHNVENIARIPVVQKAWKEGRELRIHGLVYQLHNGILHDLEVGINGLEEIPQDHRMY